MTPGSGLGKVAGSSTNDTTGDSRQRDEDYMRLAMAEARKGHGRTNPNPMVGAVIVANDRLVAVGHHQRAGGPHAELVALEAAKEAARGAELFVNLEPCCHRGRTQACSNVLIEAGVRRVVAGVIDPNPLVSGQGLDALRQAGVEVTCGVLETECRELNAAFFKYIQTGLPFVTAKYAMSLDGKIASRTGDARWISNRHSREWSHRLRNENDAILVGANTLLHDNPSLTTRGIPNSRDPIRVVIDPRGRISDNAKVLSQQSDAPTWLVCRTDVAETVAARLGPDHDIIPLDPDDSGRLPLHALLKILGEREVMTLLVEGGGETFGSLFIEQLVDQVVVFVAPKLVGGRTAPTPFGGDGIPVMGAALNLENVEITRLGDDVAVSGRLVRRPVTSEE